MVVDPFFALYIWYLGVRRENVEGSDVLSISVLGPHAGRRQINGPLAAQVPVLGFA